MSRASGRVDLDSENSITVLLPTVGPPTRSAVLVELRAARESELESYSLGCRGLKLQAPWH